MLIPLGTDRLLRRRPVVTPALIALNLVVFIVMGFLASTDTQLHQQTLQDLWVVRGEGFHPWALVTSAFLHAGLWHLLGNMVFLWVFGPGVEDRLGRVAFTVFYVAGAIASAAAHIAWETSPAVGASGAIAAVTGAYLVLMPRTSVRCFFLIGGLVMAPAWWLIGFQIAWNLLGEAIGLNDRVARIAHLAGYAGGISTAFTLLWTGVLAREPYDLFTVLKQAKRRRELRAAATTALPKPVRAAQAHAPEIDRLAEARARVSGLVRTGSADELARAYAELIERYPADAGATLARDGQSRLAARLLQEGRHALAAEAYRRFIDAYPRDAEADAARVLLARVRGVHLGRPDDARPLLETVLAGDAPEDIKALAREELSQWPEPAGPTQDGAPA
ncbi:MAG: rhomboid family intramembrane serine protease [Planctomycetota bacterium]